MDLSVAPVRVRKQSRSISRPRDKAAHFDRRPYEPKYHLSMSRGKDTVRYPERVEALAGWIDQVFAIFKERLRWSKSKVIDASGVSRASVYRWRDTSENGQFPEPESLDKFCANLYQHLPIPLLDPEIPYGILGWGKPGAMAAARVKGRSDGRQESDLDRQIRLIQARLDQGPPDEERRRLERLLLRVKRRREEQREMDEELAEILGSEPDPSHPTE